MLISPSGLDKGMMMRSDLLEKSIAQHGEPLGIQCRRVGQRQRVRRRDRSQRVRSDTQAGRFAVTNTGCQCIPERCEFIAFHREAPLTLRGRNFSEAGIGIQYGEQGQSDAACGSRGEYAIRHLGSGVVPFAARAVMQSLIWWQRAVATRAGGEKLSTELMPASYLAGQSSHPPLRKQAVTALRRRHHRSQHSQVDPPSLENLAAAVVRHAGARFVVITDVNPYRLDLARKVGVDLALLIEDEFPIGKRLDQIIRSESNALRHIKVQIGKVLPLSQEIVGHSPVTTTDLSDGRLELGLGAGYVREEFEAAELQYPSAGQRVDYLEHVTTYMKKHHAKVPILIAGNGNRLLTVAAQHADIIGLTGANPRGVGDPLAERIEFVRSAAGDRFADLELNLAITAVPSDNSGKPDLSLTRRYAPDMSDEELLALPAVLGGSPRDIADTLRGYRETYGLTSFTVQESHAETFAKVIAEFR